MGFWLSRFLATGVKNPAAGQAVGFMVKGQVFE